MCAAFWDALEVNSEECHQWGKATPTSFFRTTLPSKNNFMGNRGKVTVVPGKMKFKQINSGWHFIVRISQWVKFIKALGQSAFIHDDSIAFEPLKDIYVT